MDMESKGWVRAKEIIRKRKADMALKADLVEQRLKGQGHVVNNMSEGNRSSNQSPGKQRKKYDNDYRAREIKKAKEGTHHKAGKSAETAATQGYDLTSRRLVTNRMRFNETLISYCMKANISNRESEERERAANSAGSTCGSTQRGANFPG